jgi:GTP-binding protein
MAAATGTVSKLFSSSSSSFPFSVPFPLSPKKTSLSLLSSHNPPISFLSSLSFPKLTPLKSSANTTQHFEEEEVEEEEEEDIVSETEIDEYESEIDIEDLEKEAKFAVKELSTSLSRQLTIGAAFPSFLPSFHEFIFIIL